MQESAAAPWYLWAIIIVVAVIAFWYYARKKD